MQIEIPKTIPWSTSWYRQLNIMHLHGIFCCILCWNDPHRVVTPMGKNISCLAAQPRNFVKIFAVLDPNSSIEYHWIPWVFKLLPFWIYENRLRFSEHLGVAFFLDPSMIPFSYARKAMTNARTWVSGVIFVDIIWYYVANYPNLHDPDQISNLVLSFTRPPPQNVLMFRACFESMFRGMVRGIFGRWVSEKCFAAHLYFCRQSHISDLLKPLVGSSCDNWASNHLVIWQQNGGNFLGFRPTILNLTQLQHW